MLYAPCTVSTRFLSPYEPDEPGGAEVGTLPLTPGLAQLAERATVFERHQTEAAMSGIAYASLFTGGQAPHHGIYQHPQPLPEEITTIAEAFADAGYETYAWSNHAMASPSLNYTQGVSEANTHERVLEASDPDFRALLDRLERDRGARAFVVANFTLTHAPYEISRDFCARLPAACPQDVSEEDWARYARLYAEHWGRFSMDFEHTARRVELGEADREPFARVIDALYKGEVAHLDRVFTAIVSEIRAHRLLRQSLIAFTADHGEVLYRADRRFPWTHGFELAPEELHVPFVLFGPHSGVPAGRYSGVTRSIDVFPTLAGLAGIEVESGEFRGVDLSAAVRGQVQPPELTALSHTGYYSSVFWDHYRQYPRIANHLPHQLWVAVRSGDRLYRLVEDESGALVVGELDLASDPGGRPVAREDVPGAEALRAAHEQLTRDARRRDEQRPAPSEEEEAAMLERLSALGYVGYIPLD